jgi:hypothetical protein
MSTAATKGQRAQAGGVELFGLAICCWEVSQESHSVSRFPSWLSFAFPSGWRPCHSTVHFPSCSYSLWLACSTVTAPL